MIKSANWTSKNVLTTVIIRAGKLEYTVWHQKYVLVSEGEDCNQ